MFCTKCGKDIIGVNRCFYCGATISGERINSQLTTERRERKAKKFNSVEIDDTEALAFKRKGIAKVLIALALVEYAGAGVLIMFHMSIFHLLRLPILLLPGILSSLILLLSVGIVILKRAKTLKIIIKETKNCFGKTHAKQFEKEVLKLIKEKKFDELNDLLSLNHDEMEKAKLSGKDQG